MSSRWRGDAPGLSLGSSFDTLMINTHVRFALGAVLGYVDVSVVHPTGRWVRARASRRPLAAAKVVEARKDRKYLARATAEHALFFPFVLETFGGWGTKAQALTKLLAGHAAEHSARWTAADIRRALRKGVLEQLQLRNLRLLSEQLALSHAPPLTPVTQPRRRGRRPGPPALGHSSSPRDPPGPPGPPGLPPSRRRQRTAARRVSTGTVTLTEGRRSLEEVLLVRLSQRTSTTTPQTPTSALVTPTPSPARPVTAPANGRASSTPMELNQEAHQSTIQPTDSAPQEGARDPASPSNVTSPLTQTEPTPTPSRPPDASDAT